MQNQLQPLREGEMAVVPLQSRPAFEAQTAATPVDSEKAAEMEALLDLLHKESVRRKREKRSYALALSLLVTVCVVSVCINVILTGRVHWDIVSSMGGFIGLIGMTLGLSKKQKDALKKLADFQDMRTVGPLAEATVDPSLMPIVGPRLMDLLPHMRAKDAALLNSEQRICLRNVLCKACYGRNTLLAIAILKAFEQVGDESALHAVEMLASGETEESRGPDTRIKRGFRYGKMDPQIVRAAQECLPFLKQRVELARSESGLLRPSCVAVQPNQLLRPLEARVKTDTQALLRPSEKIS